MRILHVFPYCPAPPQFGGALRIYNLLRMMAERHEVTVAFYGSARGADLMKNSFGGKLKKIISTPRGWPRKHMRLGQIYSLMTPHSQFFNLGWSRKMEELLLREVESSQFDLIQTEFPHMGSFALPDEIPKILDAHNVEYDVIRRQWMMATSPLRKFHYYAEYKKLFREELEVCRKQNLLIATSERDRDLFHTHLPGMPISVVPNGVDSEFFQPADSLQEPNTLVFTGIMNYLPNNEGMFFFLREIFPLIRKQVPDVKIFIVGANPPPDLQALGTDHIIFTGRVDDVRPFVNRAQVSVVPLRMGGGTRLKILESFAMKKPVVSTTLGAEGLDVRQGESILIADEPGDFADSVVSLLKNRSKRESLSANAYELVKTTYEWSVLADLLEAAYSEVQNHRPSVTQDRTPSVGKVSPATKR